MKTELKFLDHPKTVNRLLLCFYIVLALLLALDFWTPKHGHFAWEDQPEFFAAYGFVSCVAVILLAKLLRRFIGRRETYYDERN